MFWLLILGICICCLLAIVVMAEDRNKRAARKAARVVILLVVLVVGFSILFNLVGNPAVLDAITEARASDTEVTGQIALLME